MRLIIRVAGCDDSTQVEGEFTEEESALLRRVAQAVNATADYGCQPSMQVEDWHELDEYEQERTGKVAPR